MFEGYLTRAFAPFAGGNDEIYINNALIRGKWSIGYYFECGNKGYILPPNAGNDEYVYLSNYAIEIIKKTRCQSIGIKAKNNVDMFENDLITCKIGVKIVTYRVQWDIQQQRFRPYELKQGQYWEGNLSSFDVVGTVFDKEVNL